MRKKDDTLRETLLELARQITKEEGTEALNIRSLAKRAGVATGTVYNYFTNKDDILLALTEEYWRKTLIEMHNKIQANPFPQQLCELYTFLQSQIANSGGMLMSSLSNVETLGRQRMKSMQQVLYTTIIQWIHDDENIKPNIWNETLSEESFTDFIIMNLMVLLRMNVPKIDSFIEIIRRIIYGTSFY